MFLLSWKPLHIAQPVIIQVLNQDAEEKLN
jgi:hypothetical protein